MSRIMNLLHSQVSFDGASAYDLGFSVVSDLEGFTDFTLQSTTATGSSCSIASLSCTVLDTSMFSCISLPTDCAASLVLLAELPALVVAGNTINLTVTLQYDSNPFPIPHVGVMYTPLVVSVFCKIISIVQ